MERRKRGLDAEATSVVAERQAPRAEGRGPPKREAAVRCVYRR